MRPSIEAAAVRIGATLALSLAPGLPTPVGRAEATHEPLAIVGVAVVDARQPVARAGQTVLVADGRIVAVGPADRISVPPRSRRLEARGKFLIPGLWDVHAHLAKGGEAALAAYLAHGVTGVRDMGGDIEVLVAWRTEMGAGRRVGPRIVTPGRIFESAANFESQVRSGTVEPVERFRLPVADPVQAEAVVAAQARAGVDFLKVRTVENVEVFRALARAAQRARLRLACHPVAPLEELMDAGVASLEHALLPGLAGLDPQRREAVARRLARSGTVVVPTLVVGTASLSSSPHAAAAVLADGAGLIEPRRRLLSAYLVEDWREQIAERRSAPSGFERRVPAILEDLKLLHRAGVRLLAGTDLGVVSIWPGSSLHEELDLLVSRVGLTPFEALSAATLQAAELVGLDRELGTIEAGKRADLVLLDRDPLADIRNTRRIRAVVADGRVLDPAAAPLAEGLPAPAQVPPPGAENGGGQAAAAIGLRGSLAGQLELPAQEVFADVRLLRGLSAGQLLAVMERDYAAALGVDCEHCHVDGAWADGRKPALKTARKMIELTTALNTDLLRTSGPAGALVSCRTCHHGRPAPARMEGGRAAAGRLGRAAAVGSRIEQIEEDWR